MYWKMTNLKRFQHSIVYDFCVPPCVPPTRKNMKKYEKIRKKMRNQEKLDKTKNRSNPYILRNSSDS